LTALAMAALYRSSLVPAILFGVAWAVLVGVVENGGW